MVALSMSSATARLWLKRRCGTLPGSSSQLRLSVLATVPVRMMRLRSAPLKPVTSATAFQRQLDFGQRGIGTHSGALRPAQVLAHVGVGQHVVANCWLLRQAAQWPASSRHAGALGDVVGDGHGKRDHRRQRVPLPRALWQLAVRLRQPLHGEIKLPGMANHFYRERVDQHLRIGMRAIEILRAEGSQRLHSRKLRSFDEWRFSSASERARASRGRRLAPRVGAPPPSRGPGAAAR